MKIEKDDFAVFILTHGRPDKVLTFNTLRKQGYTGKIFLIVDDGDKTLKKYREAFGEQVLVFSKKEIEKTFDTGDNFKNRQVIVYARNACFEIAEKIGLRYFIQMDDDYYGFQYRFNGKFESKIRMVKTGLDGIFQAVFNFYKTTSAKSICLGQGGDYIGGTVSTTVDMVKTKRKAMNSFFCDVQRPFKFHGRINEDVITYSYLQSQGNLFFTILQVSLSQLQSQSNKSGMSDIYKEGGTYVKSFYAVMFCPSAVKVYWFEDGHGQVGGRLHHFVRYENCCPMVVSERFKKS